MKLRSLSANGLIHQSSIARKSFHELFQRPAEHVAVAPGRVNVIGEHTDYNDGIVLPFAIDRQTYVVGSRNRDSSDIGIHSCHFNQRVELNLDSLHRQSSNPWSNYVVGVLAEFQKAGVSIPGFDVLIHSNIPLGAGLSSSASMEVAFATFLEAISDVRLEPQEKALLCQRAEHEFAGVPCGIMDQFASVFGQKDHLIKIDCQSLEVKTVPMQLDEISFLAVDSGARHELVNGEYATRKKQCQSALEKLGYSSYRNVSLDALESVCCALSESEFRRARHVISEIDRTERALQAVQAGRWTEVGSLMYASHHSLRDDFQVSSQELDFIVQVFEEMGPYGGVIGARMTGGGFGGCVIAVINTDQQDAVADRLQLRFSERFERKARMYLLHPSAGARLL